jgi:hypothetical protein
VRAIDRPADRRGATFSARSRPAAACSSTSTPPRSTPATRRRARTRRGAAEQQVNAGATVRNGSKWSATIFVKYLGVAPAIEEDALRLRSSTTVGAQFTSRLTKTTRLTVDVFNLFNQGTGRIDYFGASRLWTRRAASTATCSTRGAARLPRPAVHALLTGPARRNPIKWGDEPSPGVLGKRAAAIAASDKPVSIAALSGAGTRRAGRDRGARADRLRYPPSSRPSAGPGRDAASSSDTHTSNWLPRGVMRSASRCRRACRRARRRSPSRSSTRSDDARRGRRARVAATLPTASGSDAAPWRGGIGAATRAIGELAWNEGARRLVLPPLRPRGDDDHGYMLGDSPLLRGASSTSAAATASPTSASRSARRAGNSSASIRSRGSSAWRRSSRTTSCPPTSSREPELPPGRRQPPAVRRRQLRRGDLVGIRRAHGGRLHAALREMRRVLVPDGLFLVVPGLYYSDIGHHLGEFSSEPFFHLKKTPEELTKLVLETPPKYIDRSGEFATNEQYWQWHTELNRITVSAVRARAARARTSSRGAWRCAPIR